jgi:hypothetical protein
MREPNRENKINMQGVNLKIHGRKAALNNCYQKAAKKVAREQEAEQTREPAGRQSGAEASAAQAAQAAAVYKQEREQVLAIVSCARRHGIHLPAPDAHNNVNTRGVLKSRRQKAAMNNCVHEVVSKATREREELAREQSQGPRRLGEEPTG